MPSSLPLPPNALRPPHPWLFALVQFLLKPVLFWQGLQVRRRTPRLPEAEGPRQGKFGRGPAELRLLIVGDSAAAGVGAPTQAEALASQIACQLAAYGHGTIAWQLVARTGLSAHATLALMAASQLQPADIMITVLGINDSLDYTPPLRWVRALDAIHSHARYRASVLHTVHCAPPRLDLLPLLPQPLRWVLGTSAARLDAALRKRVQYAKRRSWMAMPFDPRVDAPHDWLASDGFHPNPALYQRWAMALAAHIHKLLSTPSDTSNAVLPSGFSGFDTLR